MKSRPLAAGLLGLAILGPLGATRAAESNTQTQTVTLPGGGTASVTVTTSGGATPVISVSGAAAEDAKAAPSRSKVPFMGVAVLSVPPDLSAHLGLAEGLYLSVGTVQAGSPADQAGLRAHDLLTHLDDQVLVNPPQFQRLVRMRKAGDEVTVRYLRAGKEQTVKVKLSEQEMPDEDAAEAVGPAWGNPGFAPGAPDIRDHFRRMREQMQRMHGRAGFPPVLDPFGDEDDAPSGSTGSVHSSSSSSRSASMVNDQGRFTFTEQNGHKTFRAESPDGKVKFDGPVNTEEERGKVPGEFRDVLSDLDGGAAGKGAAPKSRRAPKGEGI